MKYQTIVADPPWQFTRQSRRIKPTYDLLDLQAILRFPIDSLADHDCHLYLWVPNAMIGEGIEVLRAWGFIYKTMIVWVKHQMGVGNYYRNSTEPILFGVKGHLPPLRRNARTWFLADRREHSRKPDEFYRIVETMSPGPRIDIFSRESRPGWDQWGNQCDFFNYQKGESNDRQQTVETDGSSRNAGRGSDDAVRLDELTPSAIPQSWSAA